MVVLSCVHMHKSMRCCVTSYECVLHMAWLALKLAYIAAQREYGVRAYSLLLMEKRARDKDDAKTMVEYAKKQILQKTTKRLSLHHAQMHIIKQRASVPTCHKMPNTLSIQHTKDNGKCLLRG